MSYATMDGSATQFAGQQGYMPECVRDASERRTDGRGEEMRGCRLKDFCFVFF
jgi:hypothetical protein